METFISSDGALCTAHPVPFRTIRENYSRTCSEINSGAELRMTLRAGAYAWPGGYPLYFLASDGETLSFQSVRENLPQIIQAIRTGSNGGWRIVACAVNWEDCEMTCAHSGERIPSAYGEVAK